MESAAVTTKGEDTAPVVADATDNTTTTIATDALNPIAVTNEIDPSIKSDKEMIMTTNDVEHVAVVSDLAVVSNESTITTVKATSENSKVEEDQLNTAMASTTISTDKVDEIKQNQDETALDEQQKPVTATVEKEIVINENSDANLDISIKSKSEYDEIINSTIGSGFEDAVEYMNNDEEDSVVKEQPRDVIQQENVPDNETSSQQEVEGGDGEENSSEENKDPSAPAEPVVPVPVDDDTNDPQYIPRRGRFYEHDDRMAYSTTSSEGSESDNGYEEDSGDDDGVVSDRRRIRRRHTGIKKPKSVIPVDTAENTALAAGDGTSSTKKVLAISKVAATAKDSETSVTAGGSAKKPSVGSRKSRDLDALDKWTHDLYDENEQTRKSRDELLASYGYDIREESEAPRARRHHKYGRAATTKYTRNWQDTKAYIGTAGGQQSMKVKRGGMARRSVGGPNKNIKKSTADDYTSEFPALDNSKKSEPNSSTVSSTDVEVSVQNHEQQPKTPVQNEEKKTNVGAVETGQARHHTSSRAISKSNTTSPANRNNRQDQLNGGPSSSSSTNNKNYFNRSSTESPISKEKGAQVNRDSPTAPNSNFFNRRPQQSSSSHNQHQNFKQQHFNNSQGHNQQHQHSSSPRGRNFHQHHTSHQYNRDRYFSKGSIPSSSSSTNQHNYDQQHNSVAPTTAGTGRTQHSGGHYQHYNNRQYENENQQIEPPAPPTPVVRSSKRYSVQSRRELPDPVLNFGGLSKTPQPQPPASQQQNGLVMQDQQIQPASQQLQQQQPIQIHQQPPPPLQIQQYHQPLQPIHHGMVLDHNTGMMVMAAADPSMYHHQMYATPQYATGVAPGPATGSADDPNAAAAAAAAAALQMLAAQAAVYQPVPTGATGVTSPPPGTQSLQQPETFMTTYYQPQQQPQQQPPPRRVNLAIPIVAPPPEPNQQQGNSKTNVSTTPPPTAASTN
ncbi:probable serine/threonine-protein kinase DDB_G0282963 [Rhopalosiphum maidis]|nr:probable serine/threonine-protein kinase DDB_G0282963 [Rhopalosiphum maidis]